MNHENHDKGLKHTCFQQKGHFSLFHFKSNPALVLFKGLFFSSKRTILIRVYFKNLWSSICTKDIVNMNALLI